LQELYVQAAKCAVEAVGLDGGIVLRRRDNAWEIAASHLPHPELGIRYEVHALDQLVRQPQTLFHGGSTNTAENDPAIVLAPLRNAAGQLVGAIYGYRSVRAGNARRTIRYLEAHMIELLAGAVSEGIARIEREADADRRRVLLEQAAAASQQQTTREIGTEEREVTLLFVDLRNSTALSTSLEANETYELLSQVMEWLTAAVLEHDGLIIDYYGDGLAAMWNAPADQADHAELACRAALRMLRTLPDVASDWSQELQLGIGIHTGLAHVGNTGSRRRTKYGPRGTNVNLTSRLEAATKQLEVPLVVTEETARRLSGRFVAHRICRAHLAGIKQPVDLYTVDAANNAANLSSTWHAYDKALQSFEQGRLSEAAATLVTIDANRREVPTRFLHEQIERELSRQNRRRRSDQDSDSSRGVIRLTAK
jgi:adenylate cyclase